MKLNEETLIEIEDYIQALDENVGLKIETIRDLAQAITKHRGLVKKLTIPVVIVPKGTLCDRCETEKEDAKDEMCVNCWQIYKNAY